MPPSQCPSCGAPRDRGSECAACGVVYAKAEARALRTGGEPQTEPPPPQYRPGSAVLDEIRLGRELQDARLELVERTFEQWWSARTDFSRIPFGELEGDGTLSDPSALVQHGWTAGQIVHRYAGLGVLCLVALVTLYTWYLGRARAALAAAEQATARLRTTRN